VLNPYATEHTRRAVIHADRDLKPELAHRRAQKVACCGLEAQPFGDPIELLRRRLEGIEIGSGWTRFVRGDKRSHGHDSCEKGARSRVFATRNGGER
jgi:hypothetical protein